MTAARKIIDTHADPIPTFDAFMLTHGERLMNLKWRWIDEREYESFAGYQRVVSKLVTAAGLTFIRWTKRGELTVTDENMRKITAKFAVSGNVQISWIQD